MLGVKVHCDQDRAAPVVRETSLSGDYIILFHSFFLLTYLPVKEKEAFQNLKGQNLTQDESKKLCKICSKSIMITGGSLTVFQNV